MQGFHLKPGKNWIIAVALTPEQIQHILSDVPENIEVDAREGGAYIRGEAQESVEAFARMHGIGNKAEKWGED